MKNKGFTLAELLIVIVLAGILTLIALPKYQTAVERARALEAIENVCMITQYVAIHQLLDASFTIDPNDMQDRLTSKYFTLSSSGSSVEAIRNASGWNYKVTPYGCVDVQGSSDCTRLDLPTFKCDLDPGEYPDNN